MALILSRRLIAAFIGGLFLMSVAGYAADLDIAYQEFRLENGLRVIVQEDHKAPIVAVSVWYHVGSKDEPKGKTGFAHLFEHLMFNGTENFDGEYFEPLEQVGASSMNGNTWFDRTNYFEQVPTPALDLALWLESDRMGHLLGAVTQKKLDNQRGVVQNEKRQGDNQPYGLVEYRMLAGLYPEGHPYRHSTIGSMGDLDAASLDDVKQWFKTYYGPNNAVLVLAGDIDLATAKAKAEKYFGDIPAGPPLSQMKSWVPDLSANVRDEMTDRVPNGRIYRSWTVPGRTEKDVYMLEIAARALSSGKSSRLYKDLVYDSQLANGVSADVEAHELNSVFTIQVDVKSSADPAEVERRLDRIMADFLKIGPTRDEIERASTSYIASATRNMEGVLGKASVLGQGALYAGDPGYYKNSLKWIEEAKPNEVRDVARKWLSRHYYQLNVAPYEQYGVAGGGADRSALPKVAVTPELKFPAVETDTLSNGIAIEFARRTAVPLVQIAIQFDAGYAADHGDKLGGAGMTMSMLDEGTKKRTAFEISDEQDKLGAQIGAGSTLDTSTVSLSALKSNLAPSVELWADIIRNPAFNEKDLKRVQHIRLEQIAQEQSQPVGLALRELPPLIYGKDHAYGIPFTGSGTVEDVRKITRDDMIAFQRKWLRPDNAKVFVVGDTTLAEIKPILERYLGDWKAPGVAKGEKNLVMAYLPEKSRIVIIDRPGSPQSLILAGELAPPSGAENAVAIDAMNDIIGGQFSARVNMNLREDKGWAYGAYTFMPGARGQRPFMVYAPVQVDKTADSLKELMNELTGFTDEKPATKAELEKVVNNSVRSLPGQFETSDSVLWAMMSNDRFGRPADYQAGLPALYRGLTLKGVNAAAAEVIHPHKLVWVVVGDRAKIEKGLRDLGIAEVEVGAVH